MRELTCIICPNSCSLQIDDNLNVSGNLCERGRNFALQEMTDPKRSLTTTVRAKGLDKKVIPVKTDGEISKDMIQEAMKVLHQIVIDHPVKAGDVIVENICNSHVNVIATVNVQEEKK